MKVPSIPSAYSPPVLFSPTSVNGVQSGSHASLDHVPPLKPFDLQLELMGASTFVQGLQPSALQWHKRQPRPSVEARAVEMVHEKAALVRELRFFRAIYEAMESMQYALRGLVQDLILDTYLVPPKRTHTYPADELSVILDDFARVVDAAELDWWCLESRQQARQQHDYV